MALLLLFATTLRWFPTFGMLTAGAQYPGLWERMVDFLAHLALPLATVALGLIGQYAIVMRSSIIETLSEDYVTTARAMGLTRRPDPAPPRPPERAAADGIADRDQPRLRRGRRDHGRGRVQLAGARDAVGRGADARDYPVLQGVFLLLGVSVVLANLVADLVYGALDPRVRT